MICVSKQIAHVGIYMLAHENNEVGLRVLTHENASQVYLSVGTWVGGCHICMIPYLYECVIEIRFFSSGTVHM